MKRWTLVALAAGLLAPAPCAREPEVRIARSVVRIVNHSQRGNWYTPWDSFPTQRASGSGFVVEGGLVMTNAHVVSDARMLLLFLQGDPTPHEGRVLQVGHDCDLALVEPVEPGLLDALPVMQVGGLPKLRSSVETYGYPAGGQRISSTRGVVSRIEMNRYAHSGVDSHLTVQTDAAINPGNSGGPVVQDGKVVGVAFQGTAALENVGFFIPAEVIEHFLDDVAAGSYGGYPDLGVLTSNLENPAAQRKAGMDEGETGVRVDLVFPDSSADGHLREGDVLLAIQGHRIANDGTVAVGELRLDHGVLLDRAQAGETVELTLLREGQRLSVNVTMAPYPPFGRFRNPYDVLPRYYVYGGLVFVPLDAQLLQTVGDEMPRHLIHEAFFRSLEEPERVATESVVLLRRLDHAVNADMAYHRNLVVARVNGRPIERLEDLIEAIETNREPFQVFDFAYYGRFGVLDREQADRAQAEILQRYGVPADRRL
ncbi:MAG: trypsin-like peptidase domain-containing protein [Deltaproteobacteria bacterium]|nr:trypsin-like peptidase domain-containing protein [Deltaproteobacteria bacterium]